MDRRKLEPPTTSSPSSSSAAVALPKPPPSERDRLIATQKRWNCREENEFLRVLTGYGVDLLVGAAVTSAHPQPDWSRFKIMAKLDKKSDDALSDYYKVFIAMCKRRAGVRLADDERELDGICEDISEDHARLILDRLELLSKLRELSKSGRLDDRLHLCQNNFDTPDWWESGRHDRELIRAVLKHGLYRSDYHVFNDPTYTFGASQRMFVEEVESHLLKAHLAEIEQLALLDHELTLKREQTEAAEAHAKKMAVAAAEAEQAARVAADAAKAADAATAAAAAAVAIEALVVKKEETPDAEEATEVKTEKADATVGDSEAMVIEDSDAETPASTDAEPKIKEETAGEVGVAPPAAEKSTDTIEQATEKTTDESSPSTGEEDASKVEETAAAVVDKPSEDADDDAEKGTVEKTDSTASEEPAKPEEVSAQEDKPATEATDVTSAETTTDAETTEQSAATTSPAEVEKSSSAEDVDMDKSIEKVEETDNKPADEADNASPVKSPLAAIVDPKSPVKMDVDEVEATAASVESSPAKATPLTEEPAKTSTPEKPAETETETEAVTDAKEDTVTLTADKPVVVVVDAPEVVAAAAAAATVDETTAVSSGGGDPDDDEVMKEKEKAVEEECKKQAADLKARFPDLEVTQPSRPFVKPIVDIKAIKGTISGSYLETEIY